MNNEGRERERERERVLRYVSHIGLNEVYSGSHTEMCTNASHHKSVHKRTLIQVHIGVHKPVFSGS